jgi:hypothetical protein
MRHFARFGNELLVASSLNCATLDFNTWNALHWQSSVAKLNSDKVVKYFGSVPIDLCQASHSGIRTVGLMQWLQ